MENWDFDCPQFIDFSAGLDCFAAELDYVGASGNEETPGVKKSAESYGPKMATPRIKTAVDLRNSPFVKKRREVKTDDEKVAETLGAMSSRLSKSDGFLNEINLKTPENKGNNRKHHGSPRRHTSEFCIKKKRLCPKTPVCLKRSLFPKMKKAKTTEQLELDTIADLRNKLQQQLKLNKINLKRLKMNKAPFTMDKVSKKNNHQVQDIKGRRLEDLRNPFQYPATSGNRNVHQNQIGHAAAVTKEMYSHEKGLVNKYRELNAVLKKIVPQDNALCDVNNLENNSKRILKRRGLFHLENAHGGLKFLSKQKQTVPENFSFDLSGPSLKHESGCMDKSKIIGSGTTKKQTFLNNKENL